MEQTVWLEVLDLRYGGLEARLKTTAARGEPTCGRTRRIEELEPERLTFDGRGTGGRFVDGAFQSVSSDGYAQQFGVIPGKEANGMPQLQIILVSGTHWEWVPDIPRIPFPAGGYSG